VEIQGLNDRIADSVSGQTIGNLDRSLETTNRAQNIEGRSLVYQTSSVQLDDGNTAQLDNNPVGEALQDHRSDQGNVVDQQLDNRPIGVALRGTNLTENVLDLQLADPPVAEYLSQNLKLNIGSL
jgi:hypothetical protein